MIEEAIDKIAELAISGYRQELVRPDGLALRSDQAIWYPGDGERPLVFSTELRARDIVCQSIGGVFEAARYLAKEGAITIAIDTGGIGVYLREREPVSTRALLQFNHTPAWRFACAGGVLTQKTLVRMLRQHFSGRISPSSLLQLVRSIRFAQSTEGGSEVKVGSESLGRSVLSRVTGAGDGEWPEEVFLSCQMYEDVPESALEPARLRMYFDVDVEKQAFILEPMAGEVSAAQGQAVTWMAGWLGERLGEAGVECEIIPGCSIR